MINKKGKCVNELGICLNVLLHYKKYKKLLGRQVKVIKNDGLEKYSKLVGKVGFVADFEYINFKKPIIVWFPNQEKEYCFGIDELELCKGE